MKLLTLNTHSLQEESYEQKLEWFVEGILQEKPDIIALQEVNQTSAADVAEDAFWEGQYLIPSKVPLKQDNHAAQVVHRLRQRGIECYWVWLPVKLGYGAYDEGVALLSIGRKIIAAEAFPVSRSREYQNWRTRWVLGIQVENREDWFYSVHLGWWDDGKEPFQEQWNELEQQLSGKRKEKTIWLMGDFNAPDSVSGQSYDWIRNHGWMDTCQNMGESAERITIPGIIDGWRDRIKDESAETMRLDYIFCSHSVGIKTMQVVFNGKDRPVVSDHFGVCIETETP